MSLCDNRGTCADTDERHDRRESYGLALLDAGEPLPCDDAFWLFCPFTGEPLATTDDIPF